MSSGMAYDPISISRLFIPILLIFKVIRYVKQNYYFFWLKQNYYYNLYYLYILKRFRKIVMILKNAKNTHNLIR